jgi:hypothetical protein
LPLSRQIATPFTLVGCENGSGSSRAVAAFMNRPHSGTARAEA